MFLQVLKRVTTKRWQSGTMYAGESRGAIIANTIDVTSDDYKQNAANMRQLVDDLHAKVAIIKQGIHSTNVH